MSAASKKGQTFERLVANYLALALGDTRIDIRPKNGTNDRGDIGGIRTIRGADIVIEAKNHSRMNLSGWLAEAETERGNADASAGVVVHKRLGNGAGRGSVRHAKPRNVRVATTRRAGRRACRDR